MRLKLLSLAFLLAFVFAPLPAFAADCTALVGGDKGARFDLMFPNVGTAWDLKVATGDCVDHIFAKPPGKGAGGTGGGESGVHLSGYQRIVQIAGTWGGSNCDDSEGNVGIIAIRWFSVTVSDGTHNDIHVFGAKGQGDHVFNFTAPVGRYIAGICGLANDKGSSEKQYVHALGVYYQNLPDLP